MNEKLILKEGECKKMKKRQRNSKSKYCISGKVGQYNCNCHRCRMINEKPVNDESEKLCAIEYKLYNDRGIMFDNMKNILSKHVDNDVLNEVAQEIWNKIRTSLLGID